MPHRLYQDPLSPEERAEYEDDLVAFCDRELDLLGDVRGLRVLYAGGSSPLWLEGLSQRVGERGAVTALEADWEKVESAREMLDDADLPAPVRLVKGNVFVPPFDAGSFDLACSAGLFHELDLRAGSVEEALAAIASRVRSGGRVVTSDFVDIVPNVGLEDEALERELVRETTGVERYGIGPPERLVALHERLLKGVHWQVSPPTRLRHAEKLLFGEPVSVPERLSARYEALRRRALREGYRRPASLFVEGTLP
jgi:SAM-dependent methyltransferase